jgi:hypothetical protein
VILGQSLSPVQLAGFVLTIGAIAYGALLAASAPVGDDGLREPPDRLGHLGHPAGDCRCVAAPAAEDDGIVSSCPKAALNFSTEVLQRNYGLPQETGPMAKPGPPSRGRRARGHALGAHRDVSRKDRIETTYQVTIDGEALPGMLEVLDDGSSTTTASRSSRCRRRWRCWNESEAWT